MSSDDDQGFREAEQRYTESARHMGEKFDRALREQLRTKFNVPPEFEDVAVLIWWAGKTD